MAREVITTEKMEISEPRARAKFCGAGLRKSALQEEATNRDKFGELLGLMEVFFASRELRQPPAGCDCDG